jgi:AraC-like DNA-binding protein
MTLLKIQHLIHEEVNERSFHHHPEGQFFIVNTGVVSVEIVSGRWIMPPGCIGWIPPGAQHGASMHGAMTGMSIYFGEAWSRDHLPDTFRLVRLSPLLISLLDAIAALNINSQAAIYESYLSVFAHEFCRLPEQKLFLPMPRDSRLLKMAKSLLIEPENSMTVDDWSHQIGMSRRTLTRRFKSETGWSFIQWRQQMRLLIGLEQLLNGKSVTSVSLGLGYTSVSSFIAIFNRYMGATPKNYLSQLNISSRNI